MACHFITARLFHAEGISFLYACEKEQVAGCKPPKKKAFSLQKEKVAAIRQTDED